MAFLFFLSLIPVYLGVVMFHPKSPEEICADRLVSKDPPRKVPLPSEPAPGYPIPPLVLCAGDELVSDNGDVLMSVTEGNAVMEF